MRRAVDTTDREHFEAGEVAARLAACVADILSGEYANDHKVDNVLRAATNRFAMLTMGIHARRKVEQQQRDQQRAEERLRQERERAKVYNESTPGDEALRELWERMRRKEPLWRWSEPLGPRDYRTTHGRTPQHEARYQLLEVVGAAGRGMTDTALFRAAQVKSHPDKGGTAELFKQVTAWGEELGVCDKSGRPRV